MIERLWIMSLQAAVLIGLVSIFRLFLARSPKVYSYVLWFMVLFRLLCPVLLESRFSLWPEIVLKEWESSGSDGMTEGADNERGWEAAKAGVAEMEAEAAEGPQTTLFSGGKFRRFLHGLWAAGALVTALVFLIQYSLLRRRIRTSVLEGGNVWRCERIGTPFILGVFRPGIYLPFALKEEACEWILQHERMHIRHRDNLIRTGEILALCLHWWNPAVWYAMHKWNQDMEMFCDEAVLAGKDKRLRKRYAEILLDFAMEKSGSLFSVSFGKSNTEKRVCHVLSEKRASLGKTLGVAAVMALLAAGFLTVPWSADAGTEPEFHRSGSAGMEQAKQAQAAVVDSMGRTKGEDRMESICGISREQADIFLEKLIQGATLGNQKDRPDVFRKEIAAVFAYPLHLSLEGRDEYIQNEEELLSHYEQIFTRQLLGRMKTWRREDLFYNWQGVSWGDGALWLQMRDGGIKIVSIRNE